MTDQPLLRGRDLAVWHGRSCLFEQLNFELGAAQLALVVGANGSGKTTLMRVLAGLASPSFGEATWNGSRMQALSAEERATVAYRGHLEGLQKDLTVRENLRFHAALWSSAQPHEPILEELKLSRLADTRCRYLSAGQRRRVTLAMLRLSGATLWLLDEPTTNLDSDGQTVLVHWTRNHLADGGMAVIATHQPEEFAWPGALQIEL